MFNTNEHMWYIPELERSPSVLNGCDQPAALLNSKREGFTRKTSYQKR